MFSTSRCCRVSFITVHRGGDSITSFLNEEFLNEDPLARYRASTMSSRPSSLVTAAASDLITGHASKGYWGHQFLDALERPFHSSLLFLSQTSVGKTIVALTSRFSLP
jgi:hypothetical protein